MSVTDGTVHSTLQPGKRERKGGREREKETKRKREKEKEKKRKKKKRKRKREKEERDERTNISTIPSPNLCRNIPTPSYGCQTHSNADGKTGRERERENETPTTHYKRVL